MSVIKYDLLCRNKIAIDNRDRRWTLPHLRVKLHRILTLAVFPFLRIYCHLGGSS